MEASGKLKLHYFFLYGRAEAARMALWKAGVEYEDNKVTGDDWKALKESGKLPFGQMPALEFPDGTVLAQSESIMKYLGDTYKLRPEDPLLNAKADSITQHGGSDVTMKVAPMIFSQAPDRNEKLKEAAETHFPPYFEKLASFLPADKKYLTGDTLTIYDFQCAGLMTNLLCNPNAKDADMWKAIWDKAPERVKKYHADFAEEMKDYLSARPQDFTM